MKHLRNTWYVAGWAHEIVAGRPTAIQIMGEPIVVWRTTAGVLVAFEDRCIHRLAPLSMGRCEGERLRCMYHGLLYDQSGCVIEIPGQDRVPSGWRIRTYPVVERHGWIWIWMGEVGAADAALVPAIVGLDQPGYIYGHGQLDYAAEARLINENLLDFSHVSFLHSNTAGVTEIWARQRPKATAYQRHIRVERWIKGETVSGASGAASQVESQVDVYHWYDFFIPGVLMLGARTYPAGTADSWDGKLPDLDPAGYGFTTQAVTPLTDRTTRYFYIMGRPRYSEGKEVHDVLGRPCAEGEAIYDIKDAEAAFAEDKAMIEAQQRNIDLDPARRFALTTSDQAVVLFNRLVDKLVREESTRLSLSAADPA